MARKCGKCVSYAKNTLDYAEISTADKIDNDIRTTVKRKALQSLTHKLGSSNFDMWYLLTGIYSFTQFFQSIFNSFCVQNSLLRSWNVGSLVTRHFPLTSFQALCLN